MRTGVRVCLVALGLALSSSLLRAEDAAPARLTFTKVFEGSFPEYTYVSLDRSGAAVYQGGTLEEKTEKDSFQLSPSTLAEVFGLAGALNNFQGIELEHPREVAHMGTKTFVYEERGQRWEASYNYTSNSTAERLTTLFENIARGRFLLAQLEHRLVYDRLGLLETLRAVERELNQGRLVDPQQFVPVLERIIDNRRLMELVQSRARSLLRRVGGGPARLEFEQRDRGSDWYYHIVLEEGSQAVYESRAFNQPPSLQPLRLPTSVYDRIWELVREADYFRGSAEYQEGGDRLVDYRLIYEAGPEYRKMTFTTPPSAIVAELVDTFRRALEQEYLEEKIRGAVEERSVMLQVVLRELERALRRNAVLDPTRFVPLLERIAHGADQHIDVRRQAEQLLALIRTPEPAHQLAQ